jgi:myo-inositol-1(or 4)-monophosphatase
MTLTAIDAALAAGELLRKGFGTTYKVAFKPGILNYVTEYDHLSERCIIETIQNKFPTHAFLCEESGASSELEADILWIVDPLDGTTNFAHNIPIFSISIAALDKKEGLLTGVIYQPITQELFVAEKGKGAFLNGKKIQVSATKKFAGGIGATGFPRNVDENPLHCIDHFVKILTQGTIIRNLGSSAINLVYVAAGRFDAYWAISLYSWDVAAAILMIEEAGGKVTTYDGKPYPPLSNGPMVASNAFVHEELLGYLS